MSAPTVIVFGYGELGMAAAETLLDAGARLAAIVVPSNRSGDDVDRMAAFAVQRAVPVRVQPPRRAVAAFVRQLEDAAPDVIAVWSYSMILPPAVLAVPRRGAVNVHGGVLPEYRGGHVMQWALINGEQETGATLHYMDAGVDTGPVIADSRFPIHPDADAAQVRTALKAHGSALLRRWWPEIAAGTAPRTPQDEARARYWPMRTVEDGRIDWTLPSEQICRLVRALVCNEPGAFVEVDGQPVSIRAAHAVSLPAAARAGDVGAPEAAGVPVQSRDGAVMVTRVLAGGAIHEGTAVAALLRPGTSLLAHRPNRAHV
jgi:methionyl-tRNA formyltransferase